MCPVSYMWLLDRALGFGRTGCWVAASCKQDSVLSHGILQAGQDVWAAPSLRQRFKLGSCKLLVAHYSV